VVNNFYDKLSRLICCKYQ